MTRIPEGMSEEQVLAVIDKVCSRIAHKFVFGYYTVEDIKQEAFAMAWDGLTRYDAKQPLENFLSIHVKNRLCNLKRNKFERPDKPCLKCPLKAFNKNLPSECSLFNNKTECDLYRAWSNRNTPKRNLVNTLDLDHVDDENESGMSRSDDLVNDIERDRILAVIDEKLPMNMRSDYLKQLAGIKISRVAKSQLDAELAKIIQENNLSAT
jgi:DNA-directed RNA polymerase specialized sigma24 family protein